MKRILICTAGIFICIIFIVVGLCPKNKDFVITVSELKINSISESTLKQIKDKNMYNESAIPKENAENVLKNPQEYCEISVNYVITNNSENISMDDVRITYEFDKNLQKKILSYNDGFSDKNVFINANETCSYYRQFILVNKRDISDEDVIKCFAQSEAQISYFTGPFYQITGNGLKGIGKHTHKYPVNEMVAKKG